MKMFIDLGDILVMVRDIKLYWVLVLDELSCWILSYDVLLVFIYLVVEDEDGEFLKLRYDCFCMCCFEGVLGVFIGYFIVLFILVLCDLEDGLVLSF